MSREKVYANLCIFPLKEFCIRFAIYKKFSVCCWTGRVIWVGSYLEFLNIAQAVPIIVLTVQAVVSKEIHEVIRCDSIPTHASDCVVQTTHLVTGDGFIPINIEAGLAVVAFIERNRRHAVALPYSGHLEKDIKVADLYFLWRIIKAKDGGRTIQTIGPGIVRQCKVDGWDITVFVIKQQRFFAIGGIWSGGIRATLILQNSKFGVGENGVGRGYCANA